MTDDRNAENRFKYTYSAKEQEEIKRIREKYQAPEENGMDRLRKLDAKVTQKAMCVSLTWGILGALLLGGGMSFVMTDLRLFLGISVMRSIVIGIIAGLSGLVLTAMAYPIYNKVLKEERKKIAPEILKMTEELMK